MGWGERHGTEPVECADCHALVADLEKHRNWHERMARELAGTALRMHAGTLHRVDL